MDETPHSKYAYITSVKNVKERFDALGYSIENAKRIFERRIDECLDYYDYYYASSASDKIDYEEWAPGRARRKKVTFKKYLNSIQKLLSLCIEKKTSIHEWPKELIPKTECDKIIYYCLNNDYGENALLGLDTKVISTLYIYRLVLEFFNDNDKVELDYSDLLDWSEEYDNFKMKEFDNKILVLLEGTSDNTILNYSLKKIYPHLSDIFYFIDFELPGSKKMQGGVDSVSKGIKTFILSRLNTKFIALFDNDTAGCVAKDKLIEELRSIPENIRIMTYPELKEFNKYPTIFPNGKISDDNINKRACSIELYLPDDMLIDDDTGKLMPIVWESLVKTKLGGTVNQSYQGVISGKGKAKDNIFKCIKDDSFSQYNWDKMIKLLKSVVFSFK